jgi:tetratricopeptide (TPR) repeat protein
MNTIKEITLRTFLACVLVSSSLALAEDSSPVLLPVKDALKAGSYDAAVAAGEKAVKELPDSSEAHDLLGRAYGQKAIKASVFTQFGLARKCRAEFEKAVALDPRNVDARYDLVSFHVNAPGVVGGSLDKAREQAVAIALLDPIRGHTASGNIFSSEKKWPEAEAEYRKALDLKPDSGNLHWRLGRLFEKQGRKDDAKAELREALKLDPALEGAKRDLQRLGG